jgi:hypothetical protein
MFIGEVFLILYIKVRHFLYLLLILSNNLIINKIYKFISIKVNFFYKKRLLFK